MPDTKDHSIESEDRARASFRLSRLADMQKKGYSVCNGCGLSIVHKMCIAHGTPVYMNPSHEAWGNEEMILNLYGEGKQ